MERLWHCLHTRPVLETGQPEIGVASGQSPLRRRWLVCAPLTILIALVGLFAYIGGTWQPRAPAVHAALVPQVAPSPLSSPG